MHDEFAAYVGQIGCDVFLDREEREDLGVREATAGADDRPTAKTARISPEGARVAIADEAEQAEED